MSRSSRVPPPALGVCAALLALVLPAAMPAPPVSAQPATSTTVAGPAVTTTTAGPDGTSTTGTGLSDVPAAGWVGARVLDVLPDVRDVVQQVAKTEGGTDQYTVETQPGTTQIRLAADVLFAFNKADISPAAQGNIVDAAKLVRERAKGVVRIYGYTDSVGDPAYNLDLSRRRAEAVHAALVRLLADRPTTFDVRGFGEADPVAPNRKPDGRDNPAGRRLNRRVTIGFSQ
jgi:outer membrane protein OmpA-like peptidoglycan-associated protein